MNGAPHSPWRFLTPLTSDDRADVRLLGLTRDTELDIATNMIAASRVSLIYSASGNGKTSLLQAGIVPFFANRGYTVLLTRPRPPWATQNPVLSFSKCALRDIVLPAATATNEALLSAAREELSALGSGAPYLTQLFALLEPRLHSLDTSGAVRDLLRSHMADTLGADIPEFLARLQGHLGPSARMLIICDQFEELFVHFANTPELRRYVEQLAAAWARRSLKVQFVFSMREDWVGSMIEFRDLIPEIFTHTFRLRPLRTSAAARVLEHGLVDSNFAIDTAASKRILADLGRAYAMHQAEHRLAAGLPLSPSDDPFLELPALQLICQRLWDTRTVDHPFTVEHYDTLASAPSDDVRRDGRTPCEAVIENYLGDLLQSDRATPGVAELRLECLHLMTDRIAHRRAITEEALCRELRTRRFMAREGSELAVDDIRAALEHPIAQRLVRRTEAAGGSYEYELAHDFAVRGVVRAWDRMERERAIVFARRLEAANAKDRQFTEMAETERRMFDIIEFAPGAGLALACCSLGLVIFTQRYSGIPEVLSWLAMLIFGVTAVVALIKRYVKGTIFGGLELLSASVMVTGLSELKPYGNSQAAMMAAWGLLAVLVVALTMYPLIIADVSERAGRPLAMRAARITWTDIVNCLAIVAGLSLSLFIALEFWWGDEFLVFLKGTAITLAAHAVLTFIATIRLGWHGSLPWSRLKLVGGEAAGARVAWRSVLYTSWLTASIVTLFLPLLLVGPLCIRYVTRHVSLYDVLAGTSLKSVEPPAADVHQDVDAELERPHRPGQGPVRSYSDPSPHGRASASA